MYSFWLTTVNVIAIVFVLILKWYLAKGTLKPVYYLGIIASCLFSCVNIMLFIHDPAQWSILLLNILNIYSVVMSVIGLLRLSKEKKRKSLTQ